MVLQWFNVVLIAIGIYVAVDGVASVLVKHGQYQQHVVRRREVRESAGWNRDNRLRDCRDVIKNQRAADVFNEPLNARTHLPEWP